MRIQSGRRALKRRLSVYAVASAIAVSAPLPQAANANSYTITQNPWRMVAVHDFGEEHADLAGGVFDQINPLILAALPRGKAYVEYRAPAKCVPGSLKAVLSKVSAKYGPITVSSTYRSPGKNRKAGGKRKSMHLSCRAVDFRVHANSRGLMKFLAAQKGVGGLNRYPSGFYHIDNGPRRTW
jgi:uncharacterized protein YcbK (DUF882 family)